MADTPDPQHPHLRALGREVERTARRVGQLDDLVRALAQDLATMTRPPEASAPGPGAGESVAPGSGDQTLAGRRSWLLAEDVDQALALLADLIPWLDRVYLAYADAVLPTCWLWHPEVVEELWWLRCAHAEAYHPEVGIWLRAGDWHDRQRPNLVRRLRTAVGSCELSEHQPERPASHTPAGAPLTGAAPLIAGWVAAGRPAPAPSPTSGQLAEAEQHHQRDLERSRTRR